MKPPRFSAAEWEAANLALWIRERDRCAWCGEGIGDHADRHHRLRRTAGGDRLANLVLLHPWCHTVNAGSVHQEPFLAKRRGFIVPPWADPITTPILIGQKWWLLDDDGHRTETVEPDWSSTS